MKKNLTIFLTAVVVSIAVIAMALPSLLHRAGLHPDYPGPVVELPPGKRALIITTSHGTMSTAGEADAKVTGVMASEMTHPYYSFLDAGMRVDVASVKGGEIPVDPQTLLYMIRTAEDERFQGDPALQAKVQNSLPIEGIDFTQYDIIFLAGGWGAAYDLGYSQVLGDKISQAYYAQTPVIGGVCHGVLGLINARAYDGSLLIAGRRMTGVSDKQIKELGIDSTPQHPEAELRRAGAVYESATAFRDFFATHVVVDEEQRFVTGQNQNSSKETAQKMMAIVAGQ